MGKGGAPTTTNTVQNQNVAYTPTGLQGFQDIYGKASQVASQPYQAYGGQLVQGLTPTQTGAISQISNTGPLTAANIQQYENPYQQDVINATMGNINETNRQQMADTTGKLTQAAGGIGASRIALGQGELARQQDLASNQTLAGLNQSNYSQALQTAQQQQGFGLGKAQAQLGAGGLEQQTGQAGLTAAYQQYLQQLAFPYQQTQFLAGIGLPALGAMGGQQYQTGSANQTMTPPGMSWLQGLAGAGALGYGAYQSGLFGGGQTNPTPIAQGITDPTQQARGGRIYPHFADGGDVPDDNQKNIDLGPDQFSRQEDEALAPVLSDRGYVPAEDTQIKMPDSMPKPMAPMQTQQSGSGGSGGSTLGTLASIAGTAAKIIPMFLKDGGRAYDDGGNVPMQQPLGGGAPGANSYPTPAMLGSPLTRGALPQQAQMQSPNVFYGRPLPNMLPPSPVTGQQAGQNMYEMARQALQQQQLGQALSSFRNRASSQDDDVSVSSHEYARGGYADGGDTDDSPYPDALPGVLGPIGLKGDRLDSGQARSFDDRFPSEWGEQGPTDIDRSPLANAPLATYPTPDRTLKGSRPDVRVTPQVTSDQMDAARDAVRAGVPTPPPTDVSDTRRLSPYPVPGGGFDPGTASPSDILNLNNYKDQVAQRPTVRGLMNNGDFWMRAGLNILSANPAKGPIGAIASGAAGTVGNYDQWSKEDLSSKQKAQELAGKLMEHAQKYTRMTPAERERLDIEHERLQQGHYQAVNYTDTQGRLNVGRFNTKTGQIVDSEGNPVNPSRIYGRSSRVESGDITPQQMSIIIDRYRKNHPRAIGMEDAAVRDLALQEINSQKQGTTQAPPRPQGMSDAAIIGQARTAVQNDPSKRDAVLQRLKAWGIDTSGM